MHCPQCRAEVLEKDQFCYSCGAGLSRPQVKSPEVRPAGPCPQCGQSLRPGDKFCGYCGATLSSPEKAAPAPAPPPPPKARSHGLVAFLGYMNILACLAVLTAGFFLLRSPQFEGNYFPFLLARYALISLLAGMFLFGIYLWTRKNRRDRRHAKIIIILSLVAVAAGFFIFA